MPRPKSDLKMVSFRLSTEDLAALDRIAERLGLAIEAGRYQGQPDRTAALREAITRLDKAAHRVKIPRSS
jgi:hypothetical protein